MHKRLTPLTVSLSVSAAAMAALAITAVIVSRPTVGPTHDVSALIPAMIALEPRFWFQLGLGLAGIAAVALPRKSLAAPRILAGLCAFAGLGFAIARWAPAELLLSRMTPDGPVVDVASFPPGDARILFLGPSYIEAQLHLVLGFAGSTLVLAALRVRTRLSRGPD